MLVQRSVKDAATLTETDSENEGDLNRFLIADSSAYSDPLGQPENKTLTIY